MMNIKRGLISILLFCAASTVSAASFDCTKVVTNVEKLICSNSEIEELDDKLAIIYSKAMSNSSEEQRSNLITFQKQWLKQVRNICKDIGCLKGVYLSRIGELKSSFKIPTDPYELTGVWVGDSTAARSIYGKIVIADRTIAWGGKGTGQPFCRTQHSIEKEPFGTSFQDIYNHTYIYNENSDFKTYKIKLTSLTHDCPGNSPITHLRFTLPFDNLDYANVIEYESRASGCLPDWAVAGTELCITGYIHFHRLND